jgi:hypothetical protein
MRVWRCVSAGLSCLQRLTRRRGMRSGVPSLCPPVCCLAQTWQSCRRSTAGDWCFLFPGGPSQTVPAHPNRLVRASSSGSVRARLNRPARARLNRPVRARSNRAVRDHSDLAVRARWDRKIRARPRLAVRDFRRHGLPVRAVPGVPVRAQWPPPADCRARRAGLHQSWVSHGLVLPQRRECRPRPARSRRGPSSPPGAGVSG